ncbi:MAG: glycosyltransferase family 2 protein [Cyclobacteriaceae bacterium]
MTLSTSRLAIIMPAYNAAKYIGEAVESILNQTFPDFQLWIIDDGSTDGTRQVIEEIDDVRVSKIYHNENRGRVEVVNEVISKIQTEFFTITDADDVSHPSRLEKQIALLDEDQELAMCGTSYSAIDEQGYVLRHMNLQVDYQSIHKAMLQSPQFHGPTTIMRKKVIDAFPDFYRSYFKDNVADSDLAARIVDQFKALNLPERLYYYRILKTSLSRKSYTIRFANLDKLIGRLSQQRRAEGMDDLMRNNPGRVNQYLKELSEKYVINPSLIYQQAATYHLYWKMDREAWSNIFTAIRIRPFHFKNFALLVFILVMIGRNSILKMGRSHYQTYFTTQP